MTSISLIAKQKCYGVDFPTGPCRQQATVAVTIDVTEDDRGQFYARQEQITDRGSRVWYTEYLCDRHNEAATEHDLPA